MQNQSYHYIQIPHMHQLISALSIREASNVEAILINVNGNTIHREIFKSVPANKINTLNLTHMPPPGVYILKLKAADFSENVKVIIE